MNQELSERKPVTILLVDDDYVDVKGVERALKQLKIPNPLIRAKDGVEALELLRQADSVSRPYLILLDINMPRMNGIEMLAQLRQDRKLASSVVFVLTTSKDDEDRIAAYDQHVAGYIVKRQGGDGFIHIMEMLEHYWRVVEMPCIS
ncbi:response regulator [Shewanella sp. AS16]|uniref:response regulator n=1 Tax=Shewanella sp. AS16 TaxID=2907625 RepID=UPI001F2A2F39|nr:response regulator [Shewanella sp. AS16]MCE9687999.1 response regulator [Shewanella sp. AS16]